MDKKVSRLRRAVPTRRKISELRVHRLSIFRSNLHIYANSQLYKQNLIFLFKYFLIISN